MSCVVALLRYDRAVCAGYGRGAQTVFDVCVALLKGLMEAYEHPPRRHTG